MALFRGPTATLVRCALLLLAGLSTAVLAVEPTAPDEEAIKLDQAIQVLKDEATQFQSDAESARKAYLFPAERRLTVYLSNSVDNLLLEEITLKIDDGEAIVHTYDEFSSRALLVDGSLQQLVMKNIERGPHRLEISFTGEYAKGGAVGGNHEAAFDKRFDASEIEIEILPGKRRGPPAFRVREWRQAR